MSIDGGLSPGPLASFGLGQWWRIGEYKEREVGQVVCQCLNSANSCQGFNSCYLPLSLELSRGEPISRVMVLDLTTVFPNFPFRLRGGTGFLQLLVSGASPSLVLFFLLLLIIYFGCARSQLRLVGSSLRHAGALVVACRLLVVACGIQFPDQGWNLGPLHWERRVLPTGSSGKSHTIPCSLILATLL